MFFVWLARPAIFEAAIPSAFVAILGVIFLPLTTLMYVLLWSPPGLTGFDWVWLALALVLDLGGIVRSTYGNRDRLPAYGAVRRSRTWLPRGPRHKRRGMAARRQAGTASWRRRSSSRDVRTRSWRDRGSPIVSPRTPTSR